MKSKKILIDIDKTKLKKENSLKIDFKVNCDVKEIISEINKVSTEI